MEQLQQSVQSICIFGPQDHGRQYIFIFSSVANLREWLSMQLLRLQGKTRKSSKYFSIGFILNLPRKLDSNSCKVFLMVTTLALP